MTNRTKLLLLLAGILLIAMIGLSAVQANRFKVVNMVPDPSGRVSTSTDFIVVTFNKELQPDIDYTSQIEDSNLTMRSIDLDGKKMTIRFQSLKEAVEYTFTVKDITSKSGEIIETLPFKFTAQYMSESSLSDEQRKQLIEETDKGNISDPILQHLPYGGLHFRLSSENRIAEQDDPGLLLVAELQLNRADMSDKATAVKLYQQEVLDYIKSLKLNPDDYVIRYVVIEPTL